MVELAGTTTPSLKGRPSRIANLEVNVAHGSSSGRRTSFREVLKRRKLYLVLVAGVLVAAAAMSAGCSATPSTAPEAATTQTEPAPAAATSGTPEPAITELEIKDTKVGKGAKVKSGDTVKVHYTGYFLDGTKFDSSLDRKEPFEFAVGQGLVIQGWDVGLVGMQVGGKRVLIIPSDMAYGPPGSSDGTIPSDTPLKFEIELLGITPAQ
jgi:FKBP-type peptidyl-prolyl cis-trans isomerase FkpA